MDSTERAGKLPEGRAGLCTQPCKHSSYSSPAAGHGPSTSEHIGGLALGSHLPALRKPRSSVDVKGLGLAQPRGHCKSCLSPLLQTQLLRALRTQQIFEQVVPFSPFSISCSFRTLPVQGCLPSKSCINWGNSSPISKPRQPSPQ